MSFLEGVGALTVGVGGAAMIMVVCALAREAWRAFRQARRVARYMLGKHWFVEGVRKKGFWRFMRLFSRVVCGEFGGGEFKIGSVVFPGDPSRPFRRTWAG